MRVEALAIPDVKLVVPSVHRDARGFFCETYNARALAEAGIRANFVQDNHSLSIGKGVVRGLHFQAPPHTQAKLVRVSRGAIIDLAVDVRIGSPTFGRHVAVELSAANWRQLWIPQGFAHGFCTLEPNTEVLYKATEYYAPECERGLAWDDAVLGIAWPVSADAAMLSEKDQRHPTLAQLLPYFTYVPAPA